MLMTKDSARRPWGRELRGGLPRHIGRADWANGTGPWGANALMWVGASGGHSSNLLCGALDVAFILVNIFFFWTNIFH